MIHTKTAIVAKILEPVAITVSNDAKIRRLSDDSGDTESTRACCDTSADAACAGHGSRFSPVTLTGHVNYLAGPPPIIAGHVAPGNRVSRRDYRISGSEAQRKGAKGTRWQLGVMRYLRPIRTTDIVRKFQGACVARGLEMERG